MLEFKTFDTKIYDNNNQIDYTAEEFLIIEKNTMCMLRGCYSGYENKIYVWAVISERKHFLKDAMNFLCEHYNTNNVEFTNIITTHLIKKIRNAKPVIRRFMGEDILNLEVKWEVSEE